MNASEPALAGHLGLLELFVRGVKERSVTGCDLSGREASERGLVGLHLEGLDSSDLGLNERVESGRDLSDREASERGLVGLHLDELDSSDLGLYERAEAGLSDLSGLTDSERGESSRVLLDCHLAPLEVPGREFGLESLDLALPAR